MLPLANRTELWRAVAAASLLLLAVTLAYPACAQVLMPADEAGRLLYHEGLDRAGRPIAGRVAGSSTPLRGKAMACGNCHGEDGRGRAESGVDPGDVTWTELTKPYGHLHANGRRHGAYDRSSFARAMRDGVDPGGNVLEPAMPRYDLGAEDLDALIAYMQRLEVRRDAGLMDSFVRIGTALPLTGPRAETGRAVQQALQGYFDEVNRAGGVHGRAVRLVVVPLEDGATGPHRAMQRLFRDESVFAVLAPMAAGHEKDLSRAADEARMPVIGPLTLFPENATADSPYVFYLLSGVVDEAEALAAHLHPQLALGGRPVVLLHADDDRGRTLAGDLDARLRARGFVSIRHEPMGAPSVVARRLAEYRAEAVIVLAADGTLGATARAAADAGLRPWWLIPAPLVPPDVLDWPAALDGRIVLGYPALPQAQTPAGLATLESATRGVAGRSHSAMQATALGAALVLVEAMSRAGRDMSRQKLVAALEGLQGFETGLTPLISYGPDRRIGSYGAYVVRVDLAQRAFRPQPDFVRLK